MKSSFQSLKTKFAVALLGAIVELAPAQASPFVITLEQVGSDVVLQASGSLDVSRLIPYTGNAADFHLFAQLNPSLGLVGTAGQVTLYRSPTSFPFGSFDVPISGPSSYGAGGNTFANSSSGSPFIFSYETGVLPHIPYIGVPVGYVNNTPLSSTATFTNANFASLGINAPAEFEWVWGVNGTIVDNESLTLRTGVSAVPELSTWAMMIIGFGGLFFLTYRRSSRPLATKKFINQ